jgi:two-component system response regulator FlrC
MHYEQKTDNHPEILKKLKGLPPGWTENILIVDDEEMITTLVKSLLNREGNIDIAGNGEEALNHMEKKFYKLVISDIDLPMMDGFSLYHEAVAKFPTLSHRFLFMSDNISPERKAFLDEKQIRYLSKPMKINILRDVTSEIIFSV